MGRKVALLGACVFALAAPTSGTKAWDLLLGQDDALPKTTIPETLTIPETMEAAPEHDFLADYEASVQEAAAALPLLMNVSFVNPEGLPAADPRLQTDATTVQPQQPLSSRTVSASAGENNNQRSCPVMRVNEQPIREACANNPEESCTKYGRTHPALVVLVPVGKRSSKTRLGKRGGRFLFPEERQFPSLTLNFPSTLTERQVPAGAVQPARSSAADRGSAVHLRSGDPGDRHALFPGAGAGSGATRARVTLAAVLRLAGGAKQH